MVPMIESVTFWYPTPFPQFRTIVRPPNPYLPLSLTLKKKEGGEGARAPPRPSRLTRDDFALPSHVRPTDRQTPSAGRVALIPRWNTRRSASAPRVAPPRLRGRPICEKQLTTTLLYVDDSYSVGVFVHTATVI